jgi:AraC-like DNA-binding protein
MTDVRVQSIVLNGFPAFASRRGIDFARLAAGAAIDTGAIGDHDSEIDLNALATLLDRAALETGDDCLGLHWSEDYPAAPQSLIGYLLLNARNVGDAAKSVPRFISLHLHPIDVTFEPAAGYGRLQWRFPSAFCAPRAQYASFAMGILIARLRRSAGKDWMPMSVELEHRELAPRAEVERILGPNVRFNCSVNALCIRDSVLARSSPTADLTLYALIRQLGERLLSEKHTADDIVGAARRVLHNRLENGAVTLEDIAMALDLTPRVLQARLAEAGTNFETVLQDLRQSLTDLYLRDTDLALTEIAFLLGFSELSAFTRAAGRWYGTPPSARRAELRRAPATRP